MFRGGLKWKGKCAVAQRVSDSRCEDRKSESTKFDSFKLNTTLSNLRWKQFFFSVRVIRISLCKSILIIGLCRDFRISCNS